SKRREHRHEARMIRSLLVLLLGSALAGASVPVQGPARAKEIWEKIGHLFAPPAELKDDLGAFRPVLQFEDGRAVRTAAGWQERRRELLRKWHNLLGPWPPLLEKPYAQEQWRDTAEGFVRRRIELEVAPGRKTAVYLLTPEG